MIRFDVYQHDDRTYDFKIVADNNEIIASSLQHYENETDCEHALGLIATYAMDAPIHRTHKDPVGNDTETRG